MSKLALRQLSKALADSAKDKAYRDRSINTLFHAIDLRESSISSEIRKEIAAVDPQLNNLLSDANYKKASSIIRAHILGSVNNEKSSIRLSPDNPNVVIANTFGTLSTLLKVASDKVMAYFNTILNEQGSDYIPTAGSGTKNKLLNLDHIRTVGETKIGRDLYKVSGLDPVKLISELQRKSYLTKTKRTEVFDNVIEILSYYKGTEKIFEVKGSVGPDDNNPITGKLASSYVNQQEGSDIIKKRVATFREAIEAAIKDVKWDEQQASDSYRDYTLKKLNNAAIKAGATGKIQVLDTKSNTAKNSKRVSSKIETTTRVVKPALGIKPRSKAPLITLQTINDYINSRLPEKVRANMGPDNLANRSGRFASSARMTDARMTSEGYPSLGYTYLRSPYDVFDRTLGRSPWNTPSRDPKALIEKSIREIAKDMAIGRFYVRRT